MTKLAGGRKAPPRVEVVIASPRWRRHPRAIAAIRRAIRAAAVSGTRSGSTPPTGLVILLTDDSAMRALNRQWRKLDMPTNVLSFPARKTNRPPPSRGRVAEGGKRKRVARRHLGDIAIAYETTAREAADERKPFEHHLVHLAVHGYLHLLGYDHANDREAKKMERLEAGILARLGLPDPYVPRDAAL